MTTNPIDRSPSWLTLFGAAVLIGPTVLLGAYATLLDRGPDRVPLGPEFRSLSGDAVHAPFGYIAYVTRSRCVWVVHASGAQDPRRLGCSGRRAVPTMIDGLSWTSRGDLRVESGDPAEASRVLRVYAGPAATGVIAEFDRSRGRRSDGSVVRAEAGDAPEQRTARLVLTEPGGSARTLVAVEGPPGYAFGAPQWSPDGQWILLSDRHGRLLIADRRGKNIRQLLPPRRPRRSIEAPFLTWFQGSPF